jgi:hypothetical protein
LLGYLPFSLEKAAIVEARLFMTGHVCVYLQARVYETLFKSEDPNVHENWLSDLNPRSLEVVQGCYANPSLAGAKPGDCFQFERLG